MIEFAIKSGILAAFGWVVALGLRRASAATRSLILGLTMLGLAIMPLVLPILPQWHAPFVKIEAAPVASFPSDASIPQETPQTPWPLLVWEIGAMLLGLRVVLMLGSLFVRRLSLTPVRDLRVLEIAEECGGRRPFDLMLGKPGDPPMTWGFHRPTLLLPPEATDWTADRLRSVLLHEIAHIERADWLTNVLAESMCALYWPNPFVWLGAQMMARESEKAADDHVLTRGLKASQYASELLEIVLETRGQAPASALAMAKPGGLDSRVRSILSEAACRRPVQGFAALGLVVACAGVALGISAAAPTVIERELPPTPPSPMGVASTGPNPAPAEKVQPAPNPIKIDISPVHPHHTSASVEAPAIPGPAKTVGEEQVVDAEDVADKKADAQDAMADAFDSPSVRKEIDEAMQSGAEEYRKAMENAAKEVRASLAKVDANPHVRAITRQAVRAALKETGRALRAAFADSPKSPIPPKVEERQSADPPDEP